MTDNPRIRAYTKLSDRVIAMISSDEGPVNAGIGLGNYVELLEHGVAELAQSAAHHDYAEIHESLVFILVIATLLQSEIPDTPDYLGAYRIIG